MSQPDCIAADWGTSHLRVWLMRNDGSVLHRLHSDKGMGGLSQNAFEPALLDLIGGHIGPQAVPVVICGMAGSRQGWAEAPYATAPCAPPNLSHATRVATRDNRLHVFILPGVKQTKPADVMRGEETQLAGFQALNPQFDGVVCLPGTHCKWVRMSAGEIVGFQTFMTGELFSLISQRSVLQHSIAENGWDETAFGEALDDAMARPSALASKLFSLRAEGLLNDLSPVAARARLSGLLIGVEMAAAKPYWLGQQIAIVGAHALASAYETALTAQGAPVIRTDAERMTLEGLKAAYTALKETQT